MVKFPEVKLKPVTHIEQPRPGLEFEYSVWASPGIYGDFPDLKFEPHENWLVAAKIIEIAGLSAVAKFQVYENENNREKPLQEIEGVINPRPTGEHLPPEQYGTYPLQEGLATIIDPFKILGLEEQKSKRMLIPGRNIEPGSLRVVHRSRLYSELNFLYGFLSRKRVE